MPVMSSSVVPPTSSIKTDPAPKYSFLAHPPAPQKKRPTRPPPSPPFHSVAEFVPAPPAPATRFRSSTFSAIAAWAAHVQPGSPASISPRSPRSLRRRPSLGKARRISTSSFCATSDSFLNIAPTPTTAHININTPSVGDFKADLTTVGYTSVFLQLPNTPISATLALPVKPRSPDASKRSSVFPISSPNRKSRFSRLRSLSVLGRSKSATPSSPTKMKATAASDAIIKRKKAKYATRPPPLANELALMQFADGGNMEDNIKRVMEAQSKAAGGIGVADVHRDGEGGIWWDQEEEWEYAHLLTEGDESFPHATGEAQWVTFNGSASPTTPGPLDDERRGSVSTQDSDLDPRYIVQPTDMLDADDLAAFGSALVPLVTRKPAMSVLSLPSRPRRAAKHLRKPDFLVDIAFARMPLSPKSPFSTSSFGSAGISKPKGKARRRPAPLKLSPPSPALKQPFDSPIDADKVRQDFLDASFEPPIPDTPSTPQTAPNVRHRRLTGSRVINIPRMLTETSSTSQPSPMKKTMPSKKPSMLNMIALFRSSRKEDEPSRNCTVH